MSIAQRTRALLAVNMLIIGFWGHHAMASVHFETSQGCISHPMTTPQQHSQLNIELAETNAQRARGLMDRTQLGEYSGMVFVYPTTGIRSFWMYRTRIALDIAFMDEKGVLMEVQQMEPCRHKNASRCPTYHPVAPYKMALEMAAGRFAALNITVGSQLFLRACEQVEEVSL